MDGPARRGRLHVYTGMCAGAGTTHRMLEEGNRRKAAGEDVVIGVLTDSPSPSIESLAAGLERVMPASTAYRGVAIVELDVEAAIDRRPDAVLVDELWHELPPGMRPTTRWAAVDALRDAGIDVVATLDLGHLASLADAVQTITGSPVRERLPDAVLDGADDVELVDASPATLRRRIADGLVVDAERAARLLDRVYTTANLTALRQLALRFAMRRVERELEADGGAPRMPLGALLVVVDGGPGGRDAIRRGAALAASLDVRLVALATDARVAHGGAADEAAAVADDLEFARDLGAAVLTASGRDVVDAVVETASRVRAGHVVVPARAPSLGDRLLGRGIVERLADEPDLELHLVAGRDPAA